MAAVSRVVGTTSEYALVFIPDATVSTGAGLANLIASNVTMSWYRNDMAAVSSQTLSSGTFGTWAASTFNQADSVSSLGWYGVSIPNAVFLSGRESFVHISKGPNMAPVPILYEITAAGWNNQSAISTQASSMPVNTVQILGSTPVTSAAGTLKTDLGSIYGTAPVTSAAGIQAYTWDLGRTANLTSTIALPGTSLSTEQLVNLNQIFGSAVVTTAAGVQAYTFDLGRTANVNSTVAFSSVSFSSVSVAVGDVNVSSIMGSAVVTSAPGVLTVSSVNTDVYVSSRLAASAFVTNVNMAFITGTPITGAGTSSSPWGP